MKFNAFHVFTVKDTDTLRSLRSNTLDEGLEEFPACDPELSQWRKLGFVQPMPDVDCYYFDGANKSRAMIVETRERVLPANTINRVVRERAEKLAQAQGYKVNKKHMAQLKDEVIATLLPKSHIKVTQVWVVIFNDYLVVGTASPKLCDEITSLLAEACRATWEDRSFKIERFDPRGAATKWMTALAFDGRDIASRERCDDEDVFSPRDSATLYSSGKNGGVMKVKDIPMDADEVQQKLADGWLVKDMAVMFESSLLFTLTHSCIFKGFKFSDIVLNEKLDEENENTIGAMLDSGLALFTGYVGRMLNVLGDGFDLIYPKQGTVEVDDSFLNEQDDEL